jgi:hypothetical protein
LEQKHFMAVTPSRRTSLFPERGTPVVESWACSENLL